MIATARKAVRYVVLAVRRWFLVRVYGMDIAPSSRVSWGTRLDKTHPEGIHIGEESYCASGSLILSHDYSRGIKKDTYIGKRCFIGANAIVLPGVHIGNSVVVGAGALVTKDVPACCIVGGNPARVIRRGITTSRFGQVVGQSESDSRLALFRGGTTGVVAVSENTDRRSNKKMYSDEV